MTETTASELEGLVDFLNQRYSTQEKRLTVQQIRDTLGDTIYGSFHSISPLYERLRSVLVNNLTLESVCSGCVTLYVVDLLRAEKKPEKKLVNVDELRFMATLAEVYNHVYYESKNVIDPVFLYCNVLKKREGADELLDMSVTHEEEKQDEMPAAEVSIEGQITSILFEKIGQDIIYAFNVFFAHPMPSDQKKSMLCSENFLRTSTLAMIYGEQAQTHTSIQENHGYSDNPFEDVIVDINDPQPEDQKLYDAVLAKKREAVEKFLPLHIYPPAEILVAVHYDLQENGFCRREMDSRINAYLAAGRKVIILSSKNEPEEKREDVFVINYRPPAQDPDNDDLGLNAQLEQLLGHIGQISPKLASTEVIGIAWDNCVVKTAQALYQNRFNPTINYDCTNFVEDYASAQQHGVTIQVDDQPLVPSARILAKYKAVTQVN